MVRPCVTIPITAYKCRPAHLAAAIGSALSQTWGEIEVIVSDDSPDQSLRSIVERFQDARIRYRHNSPRLGAAGNLWSCLRQAKGEYIAVLCHDDIFEPTFLEQLTPHLMANPSLALAFSDHWVIDVDGQRRIEETDFLSTKWGRTSLRAGNHRPFGHLLAAQAIPMDIASVFRRDLLPKDLPEHAGPAYDLWLAYLLCRTGYGAYYVPERLTSWRAHEDNLTSQGGLDWSLGTVECWKSVIADEDFSSIRSIARQRASDAYYSSAVRAWRAGQRADCFRYGLRSIRMAPNFRGFASCVLPVLPRRFAHRLQAFFTA